MLIQNANQAQATAPIFNCEHAVVLEPSVITVEAWEWINNFIPHFAGYVITYPVSYKSSLFIATNFGLFFFFFFFATKVGSFSTFLHGEIEGSVQILRPKNMLFRNICST